MIFVDGANGRLVLDKHGTIVRRLQLPSTAQLFSAHLPDQNAVAEYNVWDDSVRVRTLSGKLLWSHPSSAGIDCACAVDLGHGRSQGVAISYNGGGGAVLLDSGGKVIWRLTGLGNAWSIGQLHWTRGMPAGVIVAEDKLLLVGANGKVVHTIGEETGAVLGVDLNGDGRDEAITLGTTTTSGSRVSAFDLSGNRLWAAKTRGEMAFLEKPIIAGRFFGNSLLVAIVNVGGLVQFFDPHGKAVGVFRVPEGDLEGACAIPQSNGMDDFLFRTSKGLSRYTYAR